MTRAFERENFFTKMPFVVNRKYCILGHYLVPNNHSITEIFPKRTMDVGCWVFQLPDVGCCSDCQMLDVGFSSTWMLDVDPDSTWMLDVETPGGGPIQGYILMGLVSCSSVWTWRGCPGSGAEIPSQ